MKKKYRIVTDRFCGYEAQVKYSWWPFWFQMCYDGGWTNSHSSIEEAEEFIKQKHCGTFEYKSKSRVIKQVNPECE